jgi:cytochrome d ubiquinol oxidase subunit II
METAWFFLMGGMIIFYVLLDGFDLGAGVVHLLAAKGEDERRLVLRSIGPVWDGNEVFLVAGGGTLYFAFPKLYASAFSGFYLPLIIVLWLLILRGIAIELRGHLDNPVWRHLWDVVFSGASLLLTIVFGAAIANVVRGVPLDQDGWFFNPLWTDLGVSETPGILDWYTLTIGVLGAAALTLHGALWVAHKTEGGLRERSLRLGRVAFVVLAVLLVPATWATVEVQPLIGRDFLERPWAFVFPAVAVAGLVVCRVAMARGRDLLAFLGSSTFLFGLLAATGMGLYPVVLPAINDPALSLTIYNASAGRSGLAIGLMWWIPGMALTAAYFVLLYRKFRGKVTLEGEGY